jgi:formylglycine-generating enzyme required for sulfatase activity
VGEKRPNPFGLFDMHGNVAEWCWDWYDGHFYPKSPADDPRGPDRDMYGQRVLRGFSDSADRDGYGVWSRNLFLGIRLARGQSVH